MCESVVPHFHTMTFFAAIQYSVRTHVFFTQSPRCCGAKQCVHAHVLLATTTMLWCKIVCARMCCSRNHHDAVVQNSVHAHFLHLITTMLWCKTVCACTCSPPNHRNAVVQNSVCMRMCSSRNHYKLQCCGAKQCVHARARLTTTTMLWCQTVCARMCSSRIHYYAVLPLCCWCTCLRQLVCHLGSHSLLSKPCSKDRCTCLRQLVCHLRTHSLLSEALL